MEVVGNAAPLLLLHTDQPAQQGLQLQRLVLDLVTGITQLRRTVRNLLLQRLAEFGGACEQPRVADGDHRLVGKSAHHPPVLGAVEIRLRPIDAEPADTVVPQHQRCAAPRAHLLRSRLPDPVELRRNVADDQRAVIAQHRRAERRPA